MKYTVLLLRPDYLADNYGEDTYLAHVEAATPAAAVERAQMEVFETDLGDGSDTDGEPEDYLVLAVFRDHLSDLKP